MGVERDFGKDELRLKSYCDIVEPEALRGTESKPGELPFVGNLLNFIVHHSNLSHISVVL